jgi:hypothetical protein
MKKHAMLFTAIIFSLLLLSSVSYGDAGDKHRDGAVQVKEAPMLIEKGKMMKESTFDDKAAMAAEGNLMIKEGHRMTNVGMEMKSPEGHFNLQEMGLMLSHAGTLMLEKGQQKEPLTEKDKQMLKKQGENLESMGTQKLNQGKTM